MPKYPGKSTVELYAYFRNLPLDKLKDINRSYGPLFERLENCIDNGSNRIEAMERRRQKIEEERDTHIQTYDKVATEQLAFEKSFNIFLLDDLCGSRSERYLARQSFNTSPMDIYDLKLNHFSNSIFDLTSKIAFIQRNLNASLQEKRVAFMELKILNEVIEEKRCQDQSPQFGYRATS